MERYDNLPTPIPSCLKYSHKLISSDPTQLRWWTSVWWVTGTDHESCEATAARKLREENPSPLFEYFLLLDFSFTHDFCLPVCPLLFCTTLFILLTLLTRKSMRLFAYVINGSRILGYWSYVLTKSGNLHEYWNGWCWNDIYLAFFRLNICICMKMAFCL